MLTLKQMQSPPSKRNTTPSHFFKCSDLVLPWLTPQELAMTSLTCTTLRELSNSITLRRASDASRSLEPLPIPFLNSLYQHPYAYFIYQPTSSPSCSSLLRQSWGSTHHNQDTKTRTDTETRTETSSLCFVDETGKSASSGCGCEGACEGGEEGCPCVVGFGGIDGVVFECGSGCGCGLSCGNRLSQSGIRVKLKIVRDRRKGWGLFADQFIPKGQFVCEYAGELLTTKESRLRQQMYDELSSGGHFSPALLVVREHLPSKKACLRLNIDATRIGNVSRFINHSCDGGNLYTALVRSSGAFLPRLCFFASDDIKEDEELTFSYGETRLNSKDTMKTYAAKVEIPLYMMEANKPSSGEPKVINKVAMVDKVIEDKIEATKRKLHDRYEEFDKAKRQKRIQVLNYVPEQPKFCSKAQARKQPCLHPKRFSNNKSCLQHPRLVTCYC